MCSNVATICFYVFYVLITGGHMQDHSDQRPGPANTIQELFEAEEQGDTQAFKSHVVDGFYMFDGGKRLDADGLMGHIRQRETEGRFHWVCSDFDVHITGSTAWLTYTNNGTFTQSSGVSRRTFLESAVLSKADGEWKLAFWHSTQAAQ